MTHDAGAVLFHIECRSASRGGRSTATSAVTLSTPAPLSRTCMPTLQPLPRCGTGASPSLATSHFFFLGGPADCHLPCANNGSSKLADLPSPRLGNRGWRGVLMAQILQVSTVAMEIQRADGARTRPAAWGQREAGAPLRNGGGSGRSGGAEPREPFCEGWRRKRSDGGE